MTASSVPANPFVLLFGKKVKRRGSKDGLNWSEVRVIAGLSVTREWMHQKELRRLTGIMPHDLYPILLRMAGSGWVETRGVEDRDDYALEWRITATAPSILEYVARKR